MTRYVALLRGIAPTNPNMRNENLRRVAEELGFTGVRTVISSGNLIFDESADRDELQRRLEAAWPRELGFTSTSIVRSRDEIARLVDADPFADYDHGPASYLLATFLQEPAPEELPSPPDSAGFEVVGALDGVVLTVTDTTVTRTPDAMTWLERAYGKRISSRTWKTVLRIHAAMNAAVGSE